jgi:hypothetical protein
MRSDVVVMKDETVVFHPFALKSAPSGRPDVRVPLSQGIEAREPLADLMRNYGAPNFTLMIKAGPNFGKIFFSQHLDAMLDGFLPRQLSFAYPP